MLTFRQLEAFKAVMDAGTVVGAAENLRLSQPAVSRLLTDLESGIGMSLFDRRKGRLTPRREAVELCSEVDRCFVGLDRIADAAMNIRNRARTHLRMASLPGFSMGVVGGVVAQFICRNPDVSLSLEVQSRSDMIDGVADGRFDIGLATWASDNPAVASRKLASLDLVWLVPAEHPLAARDWISPADLDGFDCVLGTDHTPTRERLDQAFRDAGAEPRIRFEVTTISAAVDLVSRGLCISFASEYVHDHLLVPGVCAIPIRPALQIDMVAYYPSARPLEGTFAELIEMYTDAARR